MRVNEEYPNRGPRVKVGKRENWDYNRNILERENEEKSNRRREKRKNAKRLGQGFFTVRGLESSNLR